MTASAGIPLALYVHFPWCVSKCPYCDFNSHPVPDQMPEQEYLQALLCDLKADAPLAEGRSISSIFMGGGTPSLFSAASVEQLLTAVHDVIGLEPDAEVTLEANPGAVEHDDFGNYLKAGVNRLSLGVQSFATEQLAILGRVHSALEAKEAFRAARDAGFENINLDLMYALPNQTVSGAEDDLRQALELAPEHLSHYHLTMEPGTRFGKTPPEGLPDDEISWAMLQSSQSMLNEGGYGRYEVSAYAQPGRQCQHNVNYWSYGDYLGIGAGAHAKVTRSNGSILRYAKHAKPARFQTAADDQRFAMRADVDGPTAAFEFMLNNLRLTGGFAAADFADRVPADLLGIQAGLDEAVAKGLLNKTSSGFQPTPLGLRFLDDLQALFLPD